jgi:hypothetical protein
MNANDFGYETTDINRVAYLTRMCGFNIYNIRFEKNEKNNKPIIVFIFYDSHKMIESFLCDYENSESAKFIEGRNSLLSLTRQTNQITKEEMVRLANGS